MQHSELAQRQVYLQWIQGRMKLVIYSKRVFGFPDDSMIGESAMFLGQFVAALFDEKCMYSTRRTRVVCQIQGRFSILVHCEHVGVVLDNQLSQYFNAATRCSVMQYSTLNFITEINVHPSGQQPPH